jgi:hypothetical protein
VGLHGQHQARFHELAVDEHRACAAFPDDAPDVGSRQSKLFPEKMNEKRPGLHLFFVGFTVDPKFD